MSDETQEPEQANGAEGQNTMGAFNDEVYKAQAGARKEAIAVLREQLKNSDAEVQFRAAHLLLTCGIY